MFDIGVIPAAGIASRFKGYYYYGILPKVLFPLAGKPLIEYQLKNMQSLGVKKVYVIVNKDDVTVKRYLKRYDNNNLKFQIVRQFKPSGLGDAILTMSNIISKPFVVILGDDITLSGDLKDAAHYFLSNDFDALQLSIFDNNKEAISRSCGLRFANNLVTQIVEKPTNHNLEYRGIGIYYLKPRIFLEIKTTPVFQGELRLTDTLSKLCETKRLATYDIGGLNFNINTVDDLSKAAVHLSKVGDTNFY